MRLRVVVREAEGPSVRLRGHVSPCELWMPPVRAVDLVAVVEDEANREDVGEILH